MAASFKVANQSFSCKGPLVLPVLLDFSSTTSYELDLQEVIDRDIIDFISSVYVNLKSPVVSSDLSIRSNIAGHLVYVPAGSIGYFPVMCGNDPRFTISVSAAVATPLQIVFSNIPYFPFLQN